jgi:photosystem II stability/assembly factor-like uncharacterized protein
MRIDRRRAMIVTAALLAQGSNAAVAIPPALERPALAVRAPARAVLLAATAAGARLVAVGEHGLVALSDDDGASWRQARAVPTSVSLTAVRFADLRNGWAVGHAGVILRTTDGGETWARQADGRSLAQVALAAARRTTDDRFTKAAETLVADGPDKPLLDLHVFDSERALVIGAYGLAFETADGGASWTSAMDRLDNPKALHLYALEADGDTIYIAGEQGLLFRSEDRGRSFHRLASPYAGSWFTLAVPLKGAVIAAGLRGNAFVSTDRGKSWARLEGGAAASYVCSAVLSQGAVVLANQAGELVKVTAERARTEPVKGAPLPPVAGLVVLPSGDLLVVGTTGALRLPLPGAAR